jgi:hypothetical protein
LVSFPACVNFAHFTPFFVFLILSHNGMASIKFKPSVAHSYHPSLKGSPSITCLRVIQINYI